MPDSFYTPPPPTEAEIKYHMEKMDTDICEVCKYVIDHHSEASAKAHLKILCNWASPRKNYIRVFIFGVGIGVSLMMLWRFLS